MFARTALVAAVSLAVLLLLTVGAVSQQPPSPAQPTTDATFSRVFDELVALRAQVEALERRLASLERGDVGVLPPERSDAPASGTAALPERLMRLESIETVRADPSEFGRVTELEQESEALQRTADSLKDQIAQLAGQGSGGGHREVKDTSVSQRRAALARLMAEYQSKARIKRGEAARLRNQLNEPRQVALGTFGQVTITLRTDRDLSCVLSKATTGDHLTWWGHRESMSATEQVWRVSRLEIVDMATAVEGP